LLCAAFVALRIAGAHLHLCFDGSEPPVSLHIADAGGHHAGDDASEHPIDPVGGHVDRDVAMSGDFVAKKPTADLLLPFFVLAFALASFTLATVRNPLPTYRSPLPCASRSRLRPPLRGPPR
jgi:hypothetical protein